MARGNRDKRNRSDPEMIRVGYVSGAHGLRGAVRVRLDNPDSVLLRCVRRLTLERNGERIEYAVTGAQSASHGVFKLTLGGISGVDQVAALRGAIVMVAAVSLPPTNPGEFYYFQTIGCEIVTTTGSPVGIIEEVFWTGANDVWVVRDRSAEHLVPVIQDIVKGIDLTARRVVIEAVPGLLDRN
jgi:16S rRNA processing protein RimM